MSINKTVEGRQFSEWRGRARGGGEEEWGRGAGGGGEGRNGATSSSFFIFNWDTIKP